MRLTAKAMKGLIEPGKYNDGDGLFLHVVTATRRSWVFRYQRNGKERFMGLGGAAEVSLDDARVAALAARQLLRKGIDPLDERQRERAAERKQEASRTAFATVADNYIATYETAWSSAKHRQQWRNTVTTHANPVLGAMAIADITVQDVLKVLRPLWNTKPETASRLRSRIELILDFAIAGGLRPAPNPAAWRGNLKALLPAAAKMHTVKHHAALDWREAPAFMAALRLSGALGARALELLILTATRSGEVRGAQWDEINLDAAEWVIPAARTKLRRQHKVPLSAAAVAILEAQAELRDGSGLVFIGIKHGLPLSDQTLTAALKRMGSSATVHGMRSCFRDWAAEATNYPNHVVEQALAHAIPNAVEAAYRRGDLFEKRKALMNDWAAYLARQPAEVVPLKRGA